MAARRLNILITLQFVMVALLISQHFITTQLAYSAANSTQTKRLSGPINSLQFSADADPLLVVSGRWRMDINLDKAGVIPLEIKGFNTTLIVVSGDGSKSERYELSNFKQDSISYDNKTKISTIKGKVTFTSDNPVDGIGVVLKVVNLNVLMINLDPSKTKEQLGDTPIYGLER